MSGVLSNTNQTAVVVTVHHTVGRGMAQHPVSMTEEMVGITTYVDPTIPGFSAIIKQRYSDFIVNEVDLDNQVVHLTSYDLPTISADVQQKREQRRQEEEAKEKLNSAMDDDTRLRELAQLIDCPADDDVMVQIKTMLDTNGTQVEFVNLKPVDDKAKRTAIHTLVKERFSNRMVSETKDGVMRLRMHTKKDNQARRSNKKDMDSTWKDLGGEFCRFCIFKENRETMEAINNLVSSLRIPSKIFSIAGTKDKRGITCQWATAHRVKAERLLGLNKTLRNMKLGNFSYVPQALQLGDLRGNRFVITLRNVLVDSEDTLNRSMTSLRDRGFVNYFGLQRFGTGSVGTHEIGRAMLQSKWEEAVHLIMKPRVSEKAELEHARRHWEEHRDPKEALKLFPKRWVAEHQIVHAYHKAGHLRDHFNALQAIPRSLRMMYIHAYQSYVWNTLVSERLARYGSDKPVVGDLVAEGGREAIEMDEDEDDQGEDGGDGNSNAKSNNDQSGRRREPGGGVRAKVLTEADVDQYTIFDVIMPLPGTEVVYPTHAIGDRYRELMAQDGLDPLNMKRPHKDYSLTGSYRYILAKPENVEWQVVRYDDVDLPLTWTDLDRLEGKTGNPPGVVVDSEEGGRGKYLALILHLTLKSSQYATMAIREVCKQETSVQFQSALNPEDNSKKVEGSNPAQEAASDSVAEESSSVAKRTIDQVEDAAPAPEPKLAATEPPTLFESAQKYQCPIKVPRHPGLLTYVSNIVTAIKQEFLKDTIERVAIVLLAPPSPKSSNTSPAVLERFVFDMSPLGASDVVHEQQQSQQQLISAVAKGKQRAYDHDDEAETEHNHVYKDTYTVTKSTGTLDRQGQPIIVVGHRTVQANKDTAAMLRAMLLRISAYSSTLSNLPPGCTFTVVIETREECTGLDNSNEFPWSPISTQVPQEQGKVSQTNTVKNSILSELDRFSISSLAAAASPSPYMSPFGIAGQNSPSATGTTPISLTPRPKKIVPIKTISLDSLQLELFVEHSH
ncbi:multisubstrate pseudouridine synthase 7 [Actinomortierella wolfii]|nr:multisubstrate pseudouridine synthase 7 [Actinomortierella wolfii]